MSSPLQRRRASRRLEEYVEAIFDIKYVEGRKVVRIKDIAQRMGVSMATVTDAMKRLAAMGLVEYVPRGYVDLTEEGLRMARDLRQRENIIKLFLKEILAFPEEQASKLACRLEHDMPDEVVERLILLTRFLTEHASPEVREKLREYIRRNVCQ